MSKWIPRLGAAGAAIVLSAGLVIGEPALARDDHTAALFEIPFSFADDCGECLQPGYCNNGEHVLTSAPDEDRDRHGETDHGCDGGFCSQAHEWTFSCWITDLTNDEQEKLGNLVTNPTIEGLTEALAEFRDSVSLNVDRKAVQIRGCDQQIVLSIPLTNEQASSLGL